MVIYSILLQKLKGRHLEKNNLCLEKDSSNIQKFSHQIQPFKKIDSTNIYDKEVYVLLEKGQNLIGQ